MNNQERKDWHQLYHNWCRSNKLKELRAKWEKKQIMTIITDKDELLQQIKIMFEYHCQSEEDRDAYSWLLSADKKQLLEAYRKIIIKWTIHLKHYELREEFEVCANLKALMDLEISECLLLMDKYFDGNEDDLMEVQFLQEVIRLVIDNNWDYDNNCFEKQQ